MGFRGYHGDIGVQKKAERGLGEGGCTGAKIGAQVLGSGADQLGPDGVPLQQQVRRPAVAAPEAVVIIPALRVRQPQHVDGRDKVLLGGILRPNKTL